MYSVSPVYGNVSVDCSSSMYNMASIYNNQDTTSDNLQCRQEAALADLSSLKQRLDTLELETKAPATQSPLDIVIGCSVDSCGPAMAAVLATFTGSSIKVFCHSTNSKKVEDSLLTSLTSINTGARCGIVLIFKDTPVPYFMCYPGRQIPVSGTGNILRYISRTSLPALYNEAQLELCAEVDEVMDTVCQLELTGPTTQLINKLSLLVKGKTLLVGQSVTIADVALCCLLVTVPKTKVPTGLEQYLNNCCKTYPEMAVLKQFKS